MTQLQFLHNPIYGGHKGYEDAHYNIYRILTHESFISYNDYVQSCKNLGIEYYTKKVFEDHKNKVKFII